MSCRVCKNGIHPSDRVVVSLLKYRVVQEPMHRVCLDRYLESKAFEERKAMDHYLSGKPLSLLEVSLILGVARTHLTGALRTAGWISSASGSTPTNKRPELFEVETRSWTKDGKETEYQVTLVHPFAVPIIAVLMS
jgi:hypothetical protein